MKIKAVMTALILCGALIGSSISVLADDEFNPEKTPIEGADGCYIIEGFYVNIVDKDGNKLIDTDFRKVDSSLGEYDTLKVWYREGMNDLSAGLLSKELKVIVPQNFYASIDFKEINGIVYAEAENSINGKTDYYDMNGNLVADPYSAPTDTLKEDAFKSPDTSCSKWAEESIKSAINAGIVPDELQREYTKNITRAEFCRLAVQTYTIKTGNAVDNNLNAHFTDVDDVYITNAFSLGIVSGVGDNKFAPDNNITRQEAAVMLRNLANLLSIDTNVSRTEKFADESYFAEWANSAIYTVSAIKSGDTFVMMGTGDNKFSPWMNYTREQAIATMLRLFNCNLG